MWHLRLEAAAVNPQHLLEGMLSASDAGRVTLPLISWRSSHLVGSAFMLVTAVGVQPCGEDVAPPAPEPLCFSCTALCFTHQSHSEDEIPPLSISAGWVC